MRSENKLKEAFDMNKYSLTGAWKLVTVKNSDYEALRGTLTPDDLIGISFDIIDATVPGNLEIDLVRAGKLADPFYADNHKNRECEYMHAIYYKDFEYDGSVISPSLVFEGLDTVADIYLNGYLIGSTENMLIPHEIDLKGRLKVGENRLTVHIKPAVIEARKYPLPLYAGSHKYNLESLQIRKAPHMYSWDIMPRIVSLGIWRPVYLKENLPDRITDFYCYTRSADEKCAALMFLCNTVISRDECLDYSIEINGKCGESEFSCTAKLYHTDVAGRIRVYDPKLWWPKNAGDQPLYDVSVTLKRGDEVLDVYKTRMGIRTVELDRTSTVKENGEGRFRFIVNGKPVFLMGTNWVPVDALHSRDAKRLPAILPMLNDLGCNVIRIWGGNVYEDDILYDFCDENGILIWQDFMMGCAAYPMDDRFKKLISNEVEVIVKRLRQHPSIALWAGDNENDAFIRDGWHGEARRDPATNLITRRTVPEAIELHDFVRPYLPSSPYIDEYAYKSGEDLSEDHLWGPRDYFKGDFYRNAKCKFASETGYHGCNSPRSLEEFIPKEYLWTAKGENFDGIDNEMWLYHAASPELQGSPYTYRIKLMSGHVNTLFGTSVPCTLSDFAKASQISQAEAKKYFIERFRCGKGDKMGIIWWNLIDGWPQISDAVVDYYGIKKLAYSYIKRSQAPVCLMCPEPEENEVKVVAVNELNEEYEVSYKVTDLTDEVVKAEGKCNIGADMLTEVCKFPITEGEKHFYFIEWNYNGIVGSNHYMTNIKDINYEEYLSYIEKVGYDKFEGFSE